MATSIVSWNKIRGRLSRGEALPLGWAFDAAGEPTKDPALARSLDPTGGYKGFGLGMMVEVLCGLLAGGPIATEILPMFTSPIEARRSISHFFMAIDISRFIDVSSFRNRLQALVAQIRAMPATVDSVMVPGDPEKKAFSERSAAGIPVTPTVFDSLCEISADFREAVCL
jgi:LDH2 family malate/lactate/ureidoglycolate dehydrogenase